MFIKQYMTRWPDDVKPRMLYGTAVHDWERKLRGYDWKVSCSRMLVSTGFTSLSTAGKNMKRLRDLSLSTTYEAAGNGRSRWRTQA